ncbi:AMP deaminase [Coemansia sp. BCRC 34490]|nr:AMP deaminase [Coemansia sp. BCRC 34490]
MTRESTPESSHSSDEARNDPYVTEDAFAKDNQEAGRAFVDAMFDSKKAAAAPTEPRSILMSQKLSRVHSNAVLPQMSPRTPMSSAMDASHHSNMPPLSLDNDVSADATAAAGAAAAAQQDEDVAGERLEREIRKMMMQTDLAAGEESDDEQQRIGRALVRCMELRDKYMGLSRQRETDNPRNSKDWKVYPPAPAPAWRNYKEPEPSVAVEFDLAQCEIPGADPDGCTFELGEDGIYAVRDGSGEAVSQAPSIKEFYTDLEFVQDTVADGPVKTWAFRRLRYLDARWQLYVLLNEREETLQSKMVPHRDLYNVRKVDGHVHLASAMNQKHLLRFIKYKLKTEPERQVVVRDGKTLTLRQVFESLNLTAYDLSIDTLDMHAHKGAYHRFDKFNLKYNPIGESRLREIFMKTDNYIQGEFFAQLTKEVVSDLEQSKYQMAEYRVSIYGGSRSEWDKLAAWVVDNKVFSSNVRWLVQLPRLYGVFKANGAVQNFEQMLANIFEPLFEVTRDPRSHPKLHVFLQRVVGFDSVDDESRPERRLHRKFPPPREWSDSKNPPYSYYCYFTMANLCTLNQWRIRRGLCSFVFRPHSGEAGDPDHLAAAFLTAQAINHGILLRKIPALEYLYYLQQIGLAMSPLSNNALFLVYERNPFNTYFQRGLNVALSTDDPLQFHFTKEPLMEEYSIAAQIWKYTSVDMCELAMNSVVQSGFESEIKRHWVGRDYLETGQTEVHKTNVPLCRLRYRATTLEQEHALISTMIKKN